MPCYVLMNSMRYGTEAYLCADLDNAIEILAALALKAEQERRKDGIQRYFCIRSVEDLQTDAVAGVYPDPILPDESTAPLILHVHHCTLLLPVGNAANALFSRYEIVLTPTISRSLNSRTACHCSSQCRSETICTKVMPATELQIVEATLPEEAA